MSELQLERLTNMINNPYTWILVVFAMTLPSILKYIRRFYPESLCEKMEKEEACALEYNQKPQIKSYNKLVIFGIYGSIAISYIISYYFFENIENKWNLFIKILSGLILVGLIPIAIYEFRTRKDKECSDVIVGYK